MYSLACGGRKMTKADLVKLNDTIESTWRPVVNGDATLNMHLVDCIHDGVKYAVENEMDANHALESFSGYYAIHAMAFSKIFKERIVTSATEISNVFSDHNIPLINVDLKELMNVKQLSH